MNRHIKHLKYCTEKWYQLDSETVNHHEGNIMLQKLKLRSITTLIDELFPFPFRGS